MVDHDELVYPEDAETHLKLLAVELYQEALEKAQRGALENASDGGLHRMGAVRLARESMAEVYDRVMYARQLQARVERAAMLLGRHIEASDGWVSADVREAHEMLVGV